jgi:hypothetical protein
VRCPTDFRLPSLAQLAALGVGPPTQGHRIATTAPLDPLAGGRPDPRPRARDRQSSCPRPFPRRPPETETHAAEVPEDLRPLGPRPPPPGPGTSPEDRGPGTRSKRCSSAGARPPSAGPPPSRVCSSPPGPSLARALHRGTRDGDQRTGQAQRRLSRPDHGRRPLRDGELRGRSPVQPRRVPPPGEILSTKARHDQTMHGVRRALTVKISTGWGRPDPRARRGGGGLAAWHFENPSVVGFVTPANRGTLEVLSTW